MFVGTLDIVIKRLYVHKTYSLAHLMFRCCYSKKGIVPILYHIIEHKTYMYIPPSHKVVLRYAADVI